MKSEDNYICFPWISSTIIFGHSVRESGSLFRLLDSKQSTGGLEFNQIAWVRQQAKIKNMLSGKTLFWFQKIDRKQTLFPSLIATTGSRQSSVKAWKSALWAVYYEPSSSWREERKTEPKRKIKKSRKAEEKRKRKETKEKDKRRVKE